MSLINRRSIVAAAALLSAGGAKAQPGYPNRAVTIILGFAPGGPADLIGRIFAQKLQMELGRPVVLENRPGAGGTIASAHVARAAPDGYTLLYATSSTQAIAPALYRNLPYDPIRSFAPISQVSATPLILLVNPSLPVRSVQDLIAYGKANPGRLNFGSAGNGTPSHLGMVRFNRQTGVDAVHVPYRSGGEALTALLQGQVQVLLDATLSSGRHIEAGTARVIAVASDRRSAVLPQVPTVIEAGVPGFTMLTWSGLVAPAGTPRPVIEHLFATTRRVLAMPDLVEGFARTDTVGMGSNPEDFAAMIAREAQAWRALVDELGLELG